MLELGTIVNNNLRICVHAIPASDAEVYQGMPAFGEVGPLIIDEKVISNANTIIENEKGILPVTIESHSIPDFKKITFPKASDVIILLNEIDFMDSENEDSLYKIKIDNGYPLIKIKKSMGSKLEIIIDENVGVIISFENNFARDVFTIAVRNFVARTAKINNVILIILNERLMI